MTKALQLAVATVGLLLVLLLLTGAVSLANAHAALAKGKWSFTGSMKVARYNHTATLLKNGKVLVAGGVDSSGNMLASAELFNPTTGTWSLTGSLHVARFDHPSILLSNGKVLVAGGDDGAGYTCVSFSSGSASQKMIKSPLSPCFCPHSIKSAELYDPTVGTWSLTGNMNSPRVFHSATSLPNNKVLAAGGLKCTNVFVENCQSLASAEIYNVTTGKRSFTGSLHMPRADHRGTRLTSMVLVAGGGLVSSEIYNATTGTWSLTGSMNIARSDNMQMRLTSGQVLVTGGRGSSGVIASAEVYTS